MGHKSKKSLVRQVQEQLQSKLCPGDSKHLDKQSGSTENKIYAFSTYRCYMKESISFVKFCKKEYGAKTLEDCRPHVNEYLQHRSATCSPYTVKLDAASLGKLYGEPSTNFCSTPSRTRGAVTRSRGTKAMDSHVSQSRNAELISFLQASGLRRNEVSCVRGVDLQPCKDSPCGLGVRVRASGAKGGRERTVPLYCDKSTAQNIERMASTAGEGHMFERIHSKLDIHSIRRFYAARVYSANARPLETLLSAEKYYCRNDMKGVVLDRQAMRITSNALGHNRIQVTTHYLT